jgi:transporter family-2 protein
MLHIRGWRETWVETMVGWYFLSALAGVCFVFQQAVNSQLRIEIGSAWWAGFISYLGGTVVMMLMAVVLRDPLPAPAIGTTPLISLSGGLFGAIYIAISILMLPKLGATTVVALIVLGQMGGSVAFDHFGFLGVAQQSVTVPRIIGVLLIMGGVALTRF